MVNNFFQVSYFPIKTCSGTVLLCQIVYLYSFDLLYHYREDIQTLHCARTRSTPQQHSKYTYTTKSSSVSRTSRFFMRNHRFRASFFLGGTSLSLPIQRRSHPLTLDHVGAVAAADQAKDPQQVLHAAVIGAPGAVEKHRLRYRV